MAISKVTLNGTTLMDVTQDTVATNNLLTGVTATGADGEPVAGGLTIPTFTTQEKSVSPTEAEQVVQPDSGKDGLSKVTVGAISKTYVGSDITRRDSTSLSASGATVTVPAGYYSEQTTKDVATVTQATPSVSVNSSGLITATATQSAGYVSAGTKSGTKQLTTKSASTITPSTTDQTIAASTYLTGVQTIKGDANLVSENIAEGKSIFGITGSHASGVPLTLEVNVDTGSAVTVTNGTTTLTGTSENGKCTFTLPEAGTWTVSAQKNGNTSEPLSVEVVSDYSATMVFLPEKKTLENSTWDEIAIVSAAGKGADYWDIGDTKSVALSGKCGTLTLNTTLYCYIMGFNHNSEEEGNGIQFGTWKRANGEDVCLVDVDSATNSSDGSKLFNFNHWGGSSSPYNTNYGGWKGCDLRYDILGSTKKAPSGYGSTATTSRVGYDAATDTATNPVANTLMSCLPSALRAVMKPITKYTDNKGNSSNSSANVTASVDYLPLLAEFEIFGTRSYANQYEQDHQAQYEYYATGNPRKKYKHDVNNSAWTWWMRSAGSTSPYNFREVGTDGSNSYDSSRRTSGIAPVFMV